MESEKNQKSEEKKDHPVTVTVNNQSVNFADHKTTGAQIKATAIAQGVQIQQDFNLFEVHGTNLKPVADNDKVTLHPDQVFRAVAPDDNSVS